MHSNRETTSTGHQGRCVSNPVVFPELPDRKKAIMGAFKEPHGGELKNLYLDGPAAEAEKQLAKDYPSWDLTDRQLCDLELLLNGAFSPLEGFMGEEDYDAVVDSMRLASGVLWPMPITLDITESFGESIAVGDKLALRGAFGVCAATIRACAPFRRSRSTDSPSMSRTCAATTRPAKSQPTRTPNSANCHQITTRCASRAWQKPSLTRA